MSYVAPATRSTGNLITAAIWNQDIRDNRNYMHNCPAVQVYRTTNQTIGHNTQTLMSWDAEIFDSDALHSAATPGRIDVNDDGVYFIHVMIKWASGAASVRGIRVIVSGSVPIAYNEMRIAATAEVEMSLSCVYRLRTDLNPSQVQVYQASGGNLDIISDGVFVPRFGICWIGSGV